MPGTLRLCAVIPLVAAATLVLAPVQIAAAHLHKPLARRLPTLWHRQVLRLLGVRVRIGGRIPASRPLFIVANHVSWSDIMVLGSVMDVCFIAKSEVRGWPVINWLARLQRTVFVERGRPRETRRHADTIADRLRQGDAMVLFAEGTTSDGHRVLPFKSALFSAIHSALDGSPDGQVTVQPVAIAYTRLHGLPLGRLHQSKAAWPGDIELLPHLLAFLRNGAYDVDVVFGRPGNFSQSTSRKTIAAHMHGEVRAAFNSAMRMRDAGPARLIDRQGNDRTRRNAAAENG